MDKMHARSYVKSTHEYFLGIKIYVSRGMSESIREYDSLTISIILKTKEILYIVNRRLYWNTLKTDRNTHRKMEANPIISLWLLAFLRYDLYNWAIPSSILFKNSFLKLWKNKMEKEKFMTGKHVLRIGL